MVPYPTSWKLLPVSRLYVTRWEQFANPSSACLISLGLFPITLFTLGQLSKENTPVWLYVVTTFANGVCTGAALNYTLAHLLHLTFPETHFIVSSLLGTFRGFAGSLGSAVGGGVFARLLRAKLESGFAERGLVGKEELVRKLLGSPALVGTLVGEEREVAVVGYVTAIRGLFVAGSVLAVTVIFLQAGTGWRAPVEAQIVQAPGVDDDDDPDD